MEGVECKQEDFEVQTEFDWEAVELLHNGGNVVNGGGSGEDPSCRVLNHLKFMQVFVRQTKEKGVTVIIVGGDKDVYKNGSGVGREGGAEPVNVAQMEMGGPGDVIDVRLEG